jgi:hypothetical protein
MKLFKQSVYKFILVDEFGDTLRKFATEQEARPYLTKGTTLKKLPKQASPYETSLLLCGEALI